ncbi:MAG: hemerythrin domain-containing protein [Rubrivivax sp.]|nr:MAG: hemerythrin domain-containing protein [Rubrivivax sp.]
MPTTATHKASGQKSAAKPNAKPSAKRTSSASSSSRGEADAIKLLTTDHKEVKALFKEYEKLVKKEAGDEEKQAIAQQICTMLTVHATIEEEIFYPAAREAIKEEDLVDEATVEHATAKDLIAQIEGMSPGEELYDAKVTVLGEYIEHHVQEEEKELFVQVKKTDLDLVELGSEMATRKEELLAELGEETEA